MRAVRRGRLLVLLALGAIALAGCGAEAPTTAEAPEPAATAVDGAQGTGTPATAAASSVEGVFAELADLTGEERRARLLEITGEQDCTLRLYTSMNIEETEPVMEAFAEDTGIQVEVYRAANEDVLRRLIEEDAAGYADGADVVMNNGPEMALASREGLLAPLDTPVTEGIAVVEDDWAAANLLVYLMAWNSDLVPPEEAPTTMEEALGHDGPVAYQYQDTVWFLTLVTEYFMEQQGLTEREAVDTIKELLAGHTQIVDGHTLGANLVASGEYELGSSLFHHSVVNMIGEGAPMAWEPPVKPLIVNSLGVGVHADTQEPACAVLLTEYILTDMQPMLQEFGRTPAREGVEGGLPEGYDPIPVRLDLYLDDREHWEELNLEVVNSVGGQIREG